MNNNIKDALNFYKLNNNYNKEELKEKREQYIKEKTDITNDNLQELVKANNYYKLLLVQILDTKELLQEEVYDFEKRLVFCTKPNGKLNDLSEKYLIKLQYVKNIEELYNLENSYYDELQLALEMDKKNKKNNSKKDYLDKEQNDFSNNIEIEKLESALEETRVVIKRYQRDLKRIESLKDAIKREESHKMELTNLKQEQDNEIFKKKKYDFQNILKSMLDISNDSMVQSLLKKYQKLINNANSIKELDSIYAEFLKEYGANNRNLKYAKELKKSLKQQLENRLNENAKNNEEALELLRELCFKIDALEEKKVYEMLPIIDKIYFYNLDEDKKILQKLEAIIYIHKYNGDIVSVTEMDNNVKFYSLMKHTYFDMPKDRFDYNFLSLKSFLKHAEYVGDKNVNLISNGKRVGINFPYQKFLYYYNGIMLSFEHGKEENDNFYFYPETSFKLLQKPTWIYNDKTNKYKETTDIFLNKEYTYQTIIQNMKNRIERELADSDSKNKKM